MLRACDVQSSDVREGSSHDATLDRSYRGRKRPLKGTPFDAASSGVGVVGSSPLLCHLGEDLASLRPAQDQLTPRNRRGRRIHMGVRQTQAGELTHALLSLQKRIRVASRAAGRAADPRPLASTNVRVHLPLPARVARGHISSALI